MDSNKSRPNKTRPVKTPQRQNGKVRVAAILKAAAALIAERGYAATTMAEIAAQSDTKVGSLYRFFPHKEALANALIGYYHECVDDAFKALNTRLKDTSVAVLSNALLDLMVGIHKDAAPTIQKLLEASELSSVKPGEFRKSFQKHIAQTLMLYTSNLTLESARDISVVILFNMKAMAAMSDLTNKSFRAGALLELREMTRLYLRNRLQSKT